MPGVCAHPPVPFVSPTPMSVYHIIASDFCDRSGQALPSVLGPTLNAVGIPRVPALGWFQEAQRQHRWGLQGGLRPVAPTSPALGSPSIVAADLWSSAFALPCGGEGQPFCRSPAQAPHSQALRFQPTVCAPDSVTSPHRPPGPPYLALQAASYRQGGQTPHTQVHILSTSKE